MPEENVLYLSPEAFAHFKAVLDDPSPPHPNLIKAAMKTIQTTTVLSFDREMIKEMCALVLIDDRGFETAFNEVIPTGYTLSPEILKAFDYAHDEEETISYCLREFISYLQGNNLLDEEETTSVYSYQLKEGEAAVVKYAALNLVGTANAYLNDETDFFPWEENVLTAQQLVDVFPEELGDDTVLTHLINKTLQQFEDDE